MSYQGKSYWLDRHAYETSVQSYLEAGGVLVEETAPQNLLLDSQVKAMPLETVAREWLRKTKGGSWIDEEKGKGTISVEEARADYARRFSFLPTADFY